MLRNYFVVAIRNLTRNKFFSAINILGLAVSMSICMAIIMLVADQMEYDAYNSNRSQIYRITTYGVDHHGAPRGSVVNSASPMPLGHELRDNYTGIEKVVRIKRGFGNGWLELENQNVNIPVKGFFADPGVFDLFQYEFEHGDANTALQNPFSVVLTRKAANKLFKDENPVGQTFKVGDIGTYTVTGVLKETKKKSHIVFEALASMSSIESLKAQGKMDVNMNDWLDFWNGYTYVQLEPGKTDEDLSKSLDKIYLEHIASIPNPEVYKSRFSVQSLKDITPGPLMNNPIGPSLPWVFVYFLGGLAGIIMLTSCFNFTNLSIARSLKRAKEIGVRKVTGAARWQIFSQFLAESIVISFCALLVAVGILVVLKPLVLQLSFARIFMWDLALNASVLAAFVVFALVVGVLAGLFPAVVLSSFEPVKVLKSMNSVKLFSRIGLRKVLLGSQFTLSLIFILSVIVMYNQLELFLTKDYGFNMKENIFIRLNNTSADALKTELQKYPNVVSASAVSHVPAAGTSYGAGYKKELSDKEWTDLDYFSVDENYLINMKLELLAGKMFDAQSGENNKGSIIINEETVKAFHFSNPIDAIGQEIIHQYDSSKKTIIGVVKNYNHRALMSKLEPMALVYNPGEFGLIQVRYNGRHEDAVEAIKKSWAAVNPTLKIDYKDVEAEIKFFYNTVFGDLVNILGVIALLAIMISCLGLLGMATYTIETRMKEISIRKVLGSTDKGLIYLLSKGFLSLLLVSVIIGVPLAIFLNQLWLELMAYHTTIGFGTIAVTIGILFVLGGVTIGSQTLRAVFTNPIDNLKNE
jgi:putative ABC transport system permease protein